MTDHQRVVASVRAQIGAILGLRAAVAVLSGWLVVWGTAVLVLRGLLLVPREPLLWGLVGVVAAAIVGGVVAVRRRPSVDAIRAMLDAHWRCGGLLMATGNVDMGGWPVELPSAAEPSVHWHGGRQCGILLCCAAFLFASFFVPARFLGELGSHRLLVGAEVERLAEKVELLKEEKILPPQRAKSLEVALEQLQQEASGSDPAKTWEAMDHLEQSIAQASAEAAEDAARNAEKAAKAEELATALDMAQGQMSAQELTEAMSILAKEVKRAADDDSLVAETLSQELEEDCEKGSLKPDQLADLAQALGKCKGADLEKLRKLAGARMIDPALLELMEGQCDIDPAALAELLSQSETSMDLEELLAELNQAGRGGVDRGRGDAAMTWADGIDRGDVEFQEKILPPGALASLKDSQVQGISVGDPTADKPSETSAGGSLDVATAGRGSARTRVILPEHRKVIQRYFAREAAAGKTKATAEP
ncbi:MAG TPA: hypothetical protein VHY91_04410 [Pirellulales bacterium]|jgi:hypothetical protein|nr:hypothetical protein [Pirellulales bacterium]